jgi:hypothetical protein
MRGTVGQPMSLAGVRLTVVSANANFPGVNPYLPAAGRRFVTVEVLYENSGSDPLISDPAQWQLVDSSGYSYSPFLTGASPLLSYEVLQPGERARGVIGFDVPQSAVGLVLKATVRLDSVTVPLP